MYSQSEIDEAVAAGALTEEGAAKLRDFFEGQRATPMVDEEQFRLITSFNDIFVSLAAIILLVAVGWIGQSIGGAMGLVLSESGGDGPSVIGPLAVAATSWGLALFFTARRRMALPSILLVFAFVGSVFMTVVFLEGHILFANQDALEATFKDNSPATKLLIGGLGAIAAAAAAFAAWIHWRRFRVPVTVAAGAAAASGIAVAILAMILSSQETDIGNIILGFILLLGIGMFLFAMRWDSSDPSRVTRRSDVAFWLHLLAAPMIIHPVFALLGLTRGEASIGEGLVVVALYVAIAIAALAIDRRALLVSALAYVLYALNELFKQFGAVELNVALTALVIGSSLLLLSAFWHQARVMVVRPLPQALRARLPNLDRAVSPAPAA